MVTGGKEHVGVMGRYQYGVGPLEAVLRRLGSQAVHYLRPHGDAAHLAAAVVVAKKRSAPAGGAADGAGVYNIRVVRAYGDVPAFRGAHLVAVGVGDGSLVGTAWDAHGGVVLLRTVDPVGELGVGVHVIKLGCGLIIDG